MKQNMNGNQIVIWFYKRVFLNEKRADLTARLLMPVLLAALLLTPVISVQAQTLDEDSVAALIEELYAELETAVADEDSVSSIIEKWESRDLVGKTKKQAVDILFADVKSVVKDTAITNKLWAKWNPGTAETNPVENPPLNRNLTELDAKRKSELGSGEMSAFFSQTGQVKAFVQEKGNYKGQTYTIYKDSADPNLAAKVAAVHKAVKTIIDKGVKIPADLRIYSTNAFEAQNRAFSRDATWNPIAFVILGSAALVGGRADALSATGFGGLDKPTITTIHEIGHILHERSSGDAFWATGSIIAGKADSAGRVTGYAAQNKKEFVAEVFAGLIIGKEFGGDVLDEYQRYNGPKLGGLHFFIGRDW